MLSTTTPAQHRYSKPLRDVGRTVFETALCPVLIGRDDEVARLEDGLVAASRGQGRIVLLAGEAGVGKTRLVTELMRRASRLGFLSLSGGCAETELALPYLPILEAVGNHLAATDIEALRERLGPTVKALSQLFPQLDPYADEDRDDESQAKVRLFDAIVTLLHALSADGGLLLAVEDLHWADSSTRELLDYLTRRVRTERILIVGTFRRDEVHRRHPMQPLLQAWRRATLADVIELEPLASDSVDQMLDAIFDTDVGEDLRDLLFDRSEGNPFVLEEMLKEAIDHGDLFKDGSGRWERKASAELRIPQTVADSILLRVERLAERHAEIVRAAAVLGRAFDVATLMAVTGCAESDLFEALKASVQQQLLEEDLSVPGRFRFRHALTRESIYDDLIEPERRRLHAKAAEVLANDPSMAASDLAHHLIAAGKTAESVPFDLRAAEDAQRRLAHKDAAGFFQRALLYIQDPEERARTLCQLGVTYWRDGGELEFARKYLTEGVGELTRLGHEVDAARFRVFLGRIRWEAGDPNGSRQDYEAALPVLESAGPNADLAHVYVRLAGLHIFDLEAEEGMRLAALAKMIADEVHVEWSRLLAGLFVGAATALLGDPDAGIKLIDESTAEALALGYDWIASNGYALASIYRFGFGRAPECIDVLKTARTSLPVGPLYDGTFQMFSGVAMSVTDNVLVSSRVLTEALEHLSGSNTLLEAWAWWYLAGTLVELCRFDEADAAITDHRDAFYREEILWRSTALLRLCNASDQVERGASIAEQMFEQVPYVAGFRAIVPEVATALVAAGRIDDAERFVSEAGHESDRERGWMQLARGRVAMGRGDFEGALALLEDAIGCFHAIGYWVDEAHASVDVASVLRSLSRTPDAVVALEGALDLARTLDSKLIEERVRSQAKACGVELHEPVKKRVETPHAEPEMREATEHVASILFADVRGYTAMTNREAPAELAGRVGAFHRWAAREIEQRRGLVDKFAGDAVMATFNVAAKTLDHSLHALQSAIALQERAKLVELPIGVGIATGTAIVGRFAEGANVSVLGSATNLSARLQSAAEAGEVVLSEETYRRVRSWLEENAMSVEPKEFELKGFEGKTTAYVVRPLG